MIAMPKADKPVAPNRNSISAASAAGGGTRSSSWSAKDDETLIQARAQGLNWNQISPKHFPTKTPNACRKRHERLMERKNAEDWDGVKLDLLAENYMAVRRDMWSILADRVGEKWQLVEQKCMEKGMKNLTQAYRAAQKKNGTYEGKDDSGFGNSDFEEEPDDRHPQEPQDIQQAAAFPYPTSGYPSQQLQRQQHLQHQQHHQHHHQHHQQHQRVPSIHSLITSSYPPPNAIQHIAQ